ncbi:SulP family inorganic anion transporter [Tumebacillus flagellatus]|uniref:Sulfate transporter n=1 Tax=Tumebacillus flagellatus TaxID=1157490 RepID=A0A074LSM9_9BACL|nr:sulfate permease [Tumebacillus flagellatus]KEO83495.1 sulfate transporter [Tumebacillus flagellatus]
MRTYSLQNLKRDLVSGLIVGIIAIPLGMGFAIASGVKPEYGIYTTIFAGALISMFSGSKFQIGGPTGAFIPILFGIVMAYGYEKLLTAGFLAGILLVLMGVFRLGNLIKFIPRPVTIGFTAGIAVTIFSGQIANFLGLANLPKHEQFLANMKEILMHLPALHMQSVWTALICLTVILFTPKVFPKVPGALLGILISSLIAAWLYPGEVATIGSTFGDIPGKLPQFQMIHLDGTTIISLLPPACLIAFLGGIESLLTAVVADGMTGTKHNSNKELIGQGIANMITPLFGGIPATGAIARTATNIRSGAVSRVSGVTHSLVVLSTLLLFAPCASSIPLASMAPVLMVVAWNMSERREFGHILRSKTADSLVLVVTFGLTVLTSLTVAVAVGLGMSILFFTKRMSEHLIVTHRHHSPEIRIFHIEGPLFFGAAQSFEASVLKLAPQEHAVCVFQLDRVPFIDMTGAANLKNIVVDLTEQGRVVLLTELSDQPKDLLRKTGLYDIIGEDHLFDHTEEAVQYALTHIQSHRETAHAIHP